MNILVTAGNTQVLIDRVRCLTNIFTGRTGAAIALHANGRGHTVCLATSHPEAVVDLSSSYGEPQAGRWSCLTYRTFEDLQRLMAQRIGQGGLDAVIHCAAVSDYLSGGIFAPRQDTRFDAATAEWQGKDGQAPKMIDRAAGKIKSDEPELWLRLIRAPKLVDCIRRDWGFRGILVKFKLEVGESEEQLRDSAERSRRQSAADLMVANTLEGASAWALLGPLSFEPRALASGSGRHAEPLANARGSENSSLTTYQKISRRELPARLLDAVEALLGEKRHG